MRISHSSHSSGAPAPSAKVLGITIWWCSAGKTRAHSDLCWNFTCSLFLIDCKLFRQRCSYSLSLFLSIFNSGFTVQASTQGMNAVQVWSIWNDRGAQVTQLTQLTMSTVMCPPNLKTMEHLCVSCTARTWLSLYRPSDLRASETLFSEGLGNPHSCSEVCIVSTGAFKIIDNLEKPGLFYFLCYFVTVFLAIKWG